MKRPFNKKRFWLIVAILALIEAVILCLALQWKYIFPSKEVSDLYTRYENVDGVDVSFIKDYKVNDTVFVDVTLLEATDSMWHTLMKDFNIPTPDPGLQQFIDAGENLVVTKLVDKTHYSKPTAPSSSNCEIMAISYTTYTISVFHTVNAGERHAILYFNLDKSTNQ